MDNYLADAVYSLGVQRFLKKAGLLDKFKNLPHESPHLASSIAGLGVLAAPSVSHLAGHDMDEKTKSKLELGGLGLIAAPEAHQLYRKFRPRIA